MECENCIRDLIDAIISAREICLSAYDRRIPPGEELILEDRIKDMTKRGCFSTWGNLANILNEEVSELKEAISKKDYEEMWKVGSRLSEHLTTYGVKSVAEYCTKLKKVV